MLVNSTRRVRLEAASLQSSLLQIPQVRYQMLFFLRETASSSQVENMLGTWCIASHDVDRSVATIAHKSFKETILTEPTSADDSQLLSNFFLLDDDTRFSLALFIQRTALDPAGIYLNLNPITPPAPPVVRPFQSKKGGARGSFESTPKRDDGGDQTPRTKVDEQEESEQDRKARLRISALGAAKYVLGKNITV